MKIGNLYGHTPNGTPVYYITEQCDIENLRVHLLQQKAVACDTETTGLDPWSEKVRLLQFGTQHEIYMIDCFHPVDPTPLGQIFETTDVLKIFHNAKFDMGMLATNYGFDFMRIFDTFLCSKILSNGIYIHKFANSLGDVVERYLGIKMDKSEQKSDWSGELTQKQIMYAAVDVEVLIPLMLEQSQFLKKFELIDTAKLEFDVCIATTFMELNGIFVDKDKWEEIIVDLEARFHATTEALKNALCVREINFNSPKQVQLAFYNIGFDLPNTKEETLAPLKKKHPAIALMLEYRSIAKLLGSYGWGVPGAKKRKGTEFFLERIHPATGRIHPTFDQMGPETGRFSCRNPNVQQVYGGRDVPLRTCFIGQTINGERNKIIVADYAQVEMRILAELSGDKNLIYAIKSGGDLHSMTAATMMGLDISYFDKVNGKFINADAEFLRAAAKSINFG